MIHMKKSMLRSKTNENATGANTKRWRRGDEFHIAKFLSCVRTAFSGLPVPISLPTSQYIYFAAPAIIYLFHKISTRGYNLKAQATLFVSIFSVSFSFFFCYSNGIMCTFIHQKPHFFGSSLCIFLLALVVRAQCFLLIKQWNSFVWYEMEMFVGRVKANSKAK